MKNDSLVQSSVWARAFLVTAWLLPCLGMLTDSSSTGSALIPPGVGYLDSSRTLMLFLCFLGFLFSGARLFPQSTSGRLAMAFLLWGAISSLLNEAPFDALLFWQVWPTAVFFYLGAGPYRKELLDPKVRAVLIHAPITLISAVSLVPLIFEPDFQQIGGVFSLAGVLCNWLVLLLPLSVYDMLEGRGWHGWVAASAACLGPVVMAFTFSRASWLLGSIQLCLLLFLLDSFRPRRFAFAGLWLVSGVASLALLREFFSTGIWVLSFLCILLVPLTVEVFTARLKSSHALRLAGTLCVSLLIGYGLSGTKSMENAGQTTQTRLTNLKQFDNSSRARVELWRAAVSMAKAHPVFGVGPGDFSTYYPRHQRLFYYYSDSAHSAGLELAAEVGFVGLALFTLSFTLLLRRPGDSPATSSLERVALLGLICGLGYAQIDLAYQFGYLWLTLALLLLFIVPIPDSAPSPARATPVRMAFAAVAFITACYLLPPIRTLELSRFEKDSSLSVRTTQEVATKLPFWRHALARNYQLRLQAGEQALPSPAQTDQLLKWGSNLDAVHAMVGEWHLKNERPEEALSRYRKALELDPHDHPSYYAQIRKLAILLKDNDLVLWAEKTILTKYTPNKLALAHIGHRTGLQAQLHPVLFDIADKLNPFYNPTRTAPIYRYLYDFKPTPRAAYGLAISLYRMGRTEQARPLFEEAERRNPVFRSLLQ